MRNIENEKFDSLSYSVIGAAIDVHRELGPGLLESTYEKCLAHELAIQGIFSQRQIPMPVTYKQISLDLGYRIDLLVEKSLIVELKTVEKLLSIHQAQLLTYMKLAKVPLGLIINFNAAPLSAGIKRVVL